MTVVDENIEDMDCDELVERVTEFLDEAMPAADRRRFEHHIALCPGCQEILDQFTVVIATTGTLRPPDAATLDPVRRDHLLAVFRAWKAERP